MNGPGPLARAGAVGTTWTRASLLRDDRPRHVRVHVTPEEVRARGEGRDVEDLGRAAEHLAPEQVRGGRGGGVDVDVVRGSVGVGEGELERRARGNLHLLGREPEV